MVQYEDVLKFFIEHPVHEFGIRTISKYLKVPPKDLRPELHDLTLDGLIVLRKGKYRLSSKGSKLALSKFLHDMIDHILEDGDV